MELEKKYFEGLNADDDINLLAETDYINAENFRIGTTDVGSALRLESIGGTIHLHSLLPAPTHSYLPLCAVEDEEKRRILYFFHYTQGKHEIRCHDRATNQNYTVLTQDQADLDFSKNNLIQARVYGNLLIYTDDKQEIKIINIEAGIKLNHPTYVTDVPPYVFLAGTTRLAFDEITLLRRPPIYAPSAVKFKPTTPDPARPVNFVKDAAFQFAWRYSYRDYQHSVLSLWSKLINYNKEDTDPTNDYSQIDIKMSVRERIPQTVQVVELLVKNMDTGSVQTFKTWDRDNATELGLINSHNAGTPVLAATFYNDKAGIYVSKQEQDKIEENIPRWCKTLDTARKRLFIANYLEGFNSPLETSLKLEAVIPTTGGSTLLGVDLEEWHILFFDTMLNVNSYRTSWRVHLTSVYPNGWYVFPGYTLDDITGYPTVFPPPSPVSFSTLLFAGATEFDAAMYNLPADWYTLVSWTHPNNGLVDITGVTGSPFVALYKSNSSVQMGVAFYDRLRRQIGMFSNDSNVVQFDDRSYSGSIIKSAVQWTLTNGAPAVMQREIPKEAYYYGIVTTKNLRTRYFIQTYVEDCRYATKDDKGVITVDTSAGTPDGKTYIAIDTSSLTKDGMAWQYTPGDVARIYFYDPPLSLPNGQPGISLAIVGQQGRHLLCEYSQLPVGTLSTPTDRTFLFTDKMLVELYRPYIPSAQEKFYEIGLMMPINLPGDPLRTYSELTGIIEGDTHLLARKSAAGTTATSTPYSAEAMSSNDKFWQTWWDDTGKNFLFIRNREIRKPYSIAFSATYIIGTQHNGLSAFEVFDAEDVSPESGTIQKLLLTSKVQDDGTVMLIICYAETLAMYLGEAQISDSASSAFFVKSEGVIGSINALRGSYGTQNAESVVLHRGQAFWYDSFNGCFVRYDVNGLFPISDYKMKRVAKLIGDQYLSMTQAQIEALGSRPFIFGGVDPYHNEVMWAIPKLLTDPPKGYLIDYITYINATGSIKITDVGNDGDKIEIFVQDPVLGKVSLGIYIKQSTDTTATILAASITTVLNTNPYGYTATSAGDTITLTARPGLGASINGGGRITYAVTAVITNFLLADGTDRILINSTDKFLT